MLSNIQQPFLQSQKVVRRHPPLQQMYADCFKKTVCALEIIQGGKQNSIYNLTFQSLKQLKAFHVTNLPNLKFLMDRAWMAIVVLCQKTLFHAYMQRELHSIFSQASFLEAISPSFPENLASAKQRLRLKPQKFELLLFCDRTNSTWNLLVKDSEFQRIKLVLGPKQLAYGFFDFLCSRICNQCVICGGF